MASSAPKEAKPTFRFTIETRINSSAAAAYDFYVKPENIPKVHPFANKVEVTKVSDGSVSFTVYDDIPFLCRGFSIPVSTKATFFLDTANSSSKTVRAEGSAPLVKIWSTTTFATDPADSTKCIVSEQYNCTCPTLFKDFTRDRSYESHVEMYSTLKRLLEQQA